MGIKKPQIKYYDLSPYHGVFFISSVFLGSVMVRKLGIPVRLNSEKPMYLGVLLDHNGGEP